LGVPKKSMSAKNVEIKNEDLSSQIAKVDQRVEKVARLDKLELRVDKLEEKIDARFEKRIEIRCKI